MGREVRMVPANWQHPETEDNYGRTRLQPMYDQTFDQVFAEWLADFDRIRAGNLTDKERKDYPRGLADWLMDEGEPHDPSFYRPWKDEEATWFQIWETVSEGTPVTPPFATKEELIDYLADHGDFSDQKRGHHPKPRATYEAFVNEGWAPSAVMMGGRMLDGVEAVAAMKPDGT